MIRTSLEGKGIYAGNLTFSLVILCGGIGGVISVASPFVSQRGIDVLIDLVRYGIGGAAAAISAGAVLGILLGSAAARSFHIPFCITCGWLLSLLIYPTPYGSWQWLASAMLMVMGTTAGLFLMKGCDGFSRRARAKAWHSLIIADLVGLGAALVTAGPTRVLSELLSGVSEQAARATLFIAVMSGLIGAMLGAMAGADRGHLQGFRVLEEPLEVLPVESAAQIRD